MPVLPRIEAALARTHLRAGDLAAADAHLDAALAGSSEPAWQAACLADRAVIRRRAGDRAGAARAAADAEIAAEAAGSPAAMGAARRMAGLVALDAGDARVAIAHLDAALAAATDDRDPSAAIAALTGLAMATAATGDVDGALEHGDQAVARAAGSAIGISRRPSRTTSRTCFTPLAGTRKVRPSPSIGRGLLRVRWGPRRPRSRRVDALGVLIRTEPQAPGARRRCAPADRPRRGGREVADDGVDVDLLTQPVREGRGRPLGVDACPVEPPIDRAVDARAHGLEERPR